MNTKVSPMLAETIKTPFLLVNYIYEPKLDGVRCVAFLDGDTKLQSRSGADITAQFPELASLHTQVKKPCILDGEITSRDFNSIQHRIHKTKPLDIRIAQTQYPAIYTVFDIITLDRESVKAKPLLERKAMLSSVFADGYHGGRLITYQTEYEVAEKLNQSIEGTMAKAMYSPYLEGKRSDYWLKIKNFKEDSYYICGLTEGENDRSSTFGSLILGKLTEGKLTYVGNCGSGLSQNQLKMLLYLLEPLRGQSPFASKPDVDRPVKYWVRPELKCEVRYLERTKDGMLRFPTYRKVVR